MALEATKLLARHFGSASATRLHNYALELQLGLAELPEQDNLQAHLRDLFSQAKPCLSSGAAAQLHSTWLTGDPPQPPQCERCSWQSKGHVLSTKHITPFQERPFGVNLIGHAFEMFGIREDIRMAARALQAADVPCCVM